MTASPRRRHRPLRAITVLAALYLGTLGTFPATATATAVGARAAAGTAAVAGTGRDATPWAAMTVSVQARTVSPAVSQASNDAQVTLTYVLTNVGEVPIYQIGLTDSLVPDRRVECGGALVIRVLIPGASVACSASVELPPGAYVSRPQAQGWVYVLLVLSYPVTATGDTTFSVAAPPPPSSPPASPSPSPTPTPSASATSPSQTPAAPSASAPVAASPTAAAPTTSRAAVRGSTAASPPSPTPEPTLRHAAFLPPAPTARVRQLSTHEAVLLLFLPAAIGAAVAGAAAMRRR